MPGSGEPASATTVAHRPNVTAAAVATLAVQHAATEELLEVAYAHRGVLRPGVLSQALLRMAKVCWLLIPQRSGCLGVEGGVKRGPGRLNGLTARRFAVVGCCAYV